VLGFEVNFVGRIKNGAFHGQYGTKDKPGFVNVDGTIEPDGIAEFVWSGLSSDPRKALNHLPPASNYSWSLTGKFEDSNGSAIKFEGRTCNIDFVKR
jgi:hypothetical protein